MKIHYGGQKSNETDIMFPLFLVQTSFIYEKPSEKKEVLDSCLIY